MLVKYTLQTSSGYSRKIQDYIQGRGRTSDFVFPNGCKNVCPGEYLFQQRTIELLFKEIIVRKQRTGQACSGHCLGKRLSNVFRAEAPPSPLPTGMGLALALLAEAPCAEGLPHVSRAPQDMRLMVLHPLGSLKLFSQCKYVGQSQGHSIPTVSHLMVDG